MSEPRPEAVAAAKWWADLLAKPTRHDMGEAQGNAVLAAVTADLKSAPRTPEEIEAFSRCLAEEIEQLVAGSAWRPDDPGWNSAARCVAVEYKPEPVLVNAARRAGFELTRYDLPVKTLMLVDPGRVRVAVGYGQPWQTIWAGGSNP